MSGANKRQALFLLYGYANPRKLQVFFLSAHRIVNDRFKWRVHILVFQRQ